MADPVSEALLRAWMQGAGPVGNFSAAGLLANPPRPLPPSAVAALAKLNAQRRRQAWTQDVPREAGKIVGGGAADALGNAIDAGLAPFIQPIQAGLDAGKLAAWAIRGGPAPDVRGTGPPMPATALASQLVPQPESAQSRIARSLISGALVGGASDLALSGRGAQATDIARTYLADEYGGSKPPPIEPKRIVGAPPGVNTPRDERALQQAYLQRMAQGADARDWYTNSGQAILAHAGDNPELANQFGEALAVTSPGTPVQQNAGYAIRGHNQVLAGDPVVTGRFPTRMGPEVAQAYEGAGATGLKRQPFAENLAAGGDYGPPGARPVHDMWDAQAWGWPERLTKAGLSDTQHAWMDKMSQAVIDRANAAQLGGYSDWDPATSQAAAWAAQREAAGFVKPGQGGFSFSDAIPRTYAQGSRETVPGSNTGHMPELLQAPMDVRQSYDDLVRQVMYDAQMRDRIGMGNRALVGPSFQGPGVYEGINPGVQTQIATGSVERPNWPGMYQLGPSDEKVLGANEAAYALLTGQKAYAGNRFFPSTRAGGNALQFDLGRPVSDDEAEQIIKAIAEAHMSPDQMAVVPSAQGVRIAAAPGSDLADQTALMRTPQFQQMAANVQQRLGAPRPETGYFSGIYGENAWDEPAGRYGQQFLPKIEASPQLAAGFNQTAPDLAGKLGQLDQQFAQAHGFTISPYVQELRQAVQSGGLDGIKALVQKHGLPLAAIPMIAWALPHLGIDLPAQAQSQPGSPPLQAPPS